MSAENGAMAASQLLKPKGPAKDGDWAIPRVYRLRWLMVSLFACCSATNAYQWIHLNIIGNIIHRYYNESLPGTPYQQQLAIHWLSMVYMLAYIPLILCSSALQLAIHWLSMVYMLAYIPLILPATWLLDRHGLRVVTIIATLLNALGACIKCMAVNPGSFFILMGGQTVCAVAQIFILGIPARLAAVWFGPDEVSTATSMGVFGNQIGVALGFLIPTEIVKNDDDLSTVGYNLSIMLYSTAIVSTFFFIVVLFAFRKEPAAPPSPAQAALLEAITHEDYRGSLHRLFTNRGFLILLLTYGLNTGSYYAIGTLLNSVVLEYFPGDEVHAGGIGLTLVLSGVLGSIVAGIWLDKTKLFKSTTLVVYLMSFLAMTLFTFILSVRKVELVYVCSSLLGFFMTGYLPVGFEFAAEITYPESEGTSSGLLNASAQVDDIIYVMAIMAWVYTYDMDSVHNGEPERSRVWGIILTLGMGALMSTTGSVPANLCVSGALLLGTICTVFIKSDLRRQKAGELHSSRNEHKKLADIEIIVENKDETPEL